MLNRVSALLLFFSTLGVASSLPQDLIVCPGVTIQGQKDAEMPRFTENEKRLLCGDPDTPAWKKIPANQVKYNLKNFLQDRGYLTPEFTVESETVRVRLGTQARVTQFTYQGPDGLLDLSRKRKVVGEILTPALLGAVETWATRKVESKGYACPVITSQANPLTGALVIKVDPGDRYNLNQIIEIPAGGLAPGTMRRYDAFKLGDLYNGDWVSLTENRVSLDQVLESTHFTTGCSPEGLVLTQRSLAGLPRLFIIGGGVDTEGYIQGRVSWRNSRIGSKGTWFDLTAIASKIEQTLIATMNYYFLPYPSRIFLAPQIQFSHDNEEYYEISTEQFSTLLSRTWDNNWAQIALGIGPNFTIEHTFIGYGPENSQVLALETKGTLMSHEYEYYLKNPNQGFTASAEFDTSSRSVLSSFSVQKFSLSGESLFNIRGYDPTLIIAGLRWGASTSFTPDRPGVISLVPQNYLQYLGGSTNLRGFGRQEIPLTGVGGLTSAYASFELRLTNQLPLWMEPFIFEDVGALGYGPLELDPPLYTSPGIGIRLGTPVGVIRSTLAHGYAFNDSHDTSEHFQFYFSYGQEF